MRTPPALIVVRCVSVATLLAVVFTAERQGGSGRAELVPGAGHKTVAVTAEAGTIEPASTSASNPPRSAGLPGTTTEAWPASALGQGVDSALGAVGLLAGGNFAAVARAPAVRQSTASAATTVPSSSNPAGSSSSVVGVEPVFADEFDSLDLTTTGHQGVWRPNDIWQNIDLGYRDFAGTSWNLNPNHTPGHNPFSIANGLLTITAQPTPADAATAIATAMAAQGQTGPVPTWSGGLLVTNSNRVQFLYGYIEVRARFRNTGPGMFPAIWLYAASGSTNPTNKGGAEIDLMEIFGDPTSYDTTLHYYDNTQTAVRPDRHVATTPNDPTSWHTYALDWQPDHLIFYLDNTPIATITGPDATWFDTPMSLRLNYALNAPWFPTNHTTGPTTPTTMHMDIDYLRIAPTRG